MRLAAEGLAIDKLVEEVRQATNQSVAKVALIQVEFWDLCSKIVVLAK